MRWGKKKSQHDTFDQFRKDSEVEDKFTLELQAEKLHHGFVLGEHGRS